MSELTPLPKTMWWCHFRGKEAIQIGEEKVDIAGKFLVAWPYDHQPKLSMDLAFKVGQSLNEWQEKYITQPHIQLKLWLKVATVLGSNLGPKIQGEDEDGKQLKKVIFFSKFVFLNYMIDDQLELAANRDDFPQLVFFTSELLYLVESGTFPSLKALQAHEYYGKVLSLDPNFQDFYPILWDWSQELYKDYVASPEDAHYYCLEHYKTYSSFSWCGSKKSLHMENPLCYRENRVLNTTAMAVFELGFILAGLRVPIEIRENVYWQRIYSKSSWLNTYVNDVFSFQREWKAMERDGATMDNAVYLHMREVGAKFGDAIQHIAERHDQILLEYRAINDFLRLNPAFTGIDDEGCREVFYRSLDIIAASNSRVFQIHQVSRYSRMEIQFVECDDEEVGDVFGRGLGVTLDL